ncbi:hypothetical protein [Methylobacterium goesingense]|uniref:Sulfotransferase domain-containing protein n=1 Tax=Methylobacterium goesingense TaxID=243690 RepID=A0ABV2LDK4_9HYPH|nr:hypothetical protein [Methylobacterium goesingense]GJD76782.1 hypothetical protein CFIICLFH_5041 [Methylobacterium goesingense]
MHSQNYSSQNFTESKLDIYIAAIGRSGSTALANMMTFLPEQNVLVEPTAHTFGFNEWDIIKNPQDESKFLKYYLSLTNTSNKIGIKEVIPKSHKAIINILHPRIILILVRNIEDVYLSFTEKHIKQNSVSIFPSEWVEEYCIKSSEELLNIHKSYDNVVIIRFEDFFWSIHERKRFIAKTGWNLEGSPFKNFTNYDRLYEVERNVFPRDKSLSPLERNIENIEQEKSKIIGTKCLTYQSFFGYI